MRIIRQASYILLGLAAFFFTACSQEEIEQTKEVKQSELRVMVNHPDAAASRATISGVSTSFEAGDQIGFFAIERAFIMDDEGDLIENDREVYYNIPLTFDGNEWKPSDNVKLFHSSNFTYYAYYPYQEDLNGWTNDGEEAPEDFFEYITNFWEPKLDQSTLEDYLASDLMVGKGVSTTSGDGTGMVSFTLQHQMGLVQISLIESSGAPIDITGYNSNDFFEESMTVELQTDYFSVPYNDGQFFRYIAKPDSKLSASFKIAETYGGDIVGTGVEKGKKSSLNININI